MGSLKVSNEQSQIVRDRDPLMLPVNAVPPKPSIRRPAFTPTSPSSSFSSMTTQISLSRSRIPAEAMVASVGRLWP